jgi:hypothetical protein
MDKLPPGLKIPAGVNPKDIERFVAAHEAGLPGAQDAAVLSDVDSSYMNMPTYLRSCAFGPDFFDGVKWGAGLTFFPTVFMARRSHRRARKAMPDPKMSLWKFDPWAVTFTGACSITAVMKMIKFGAARGRVREFELDGELAVMNATDEELEAMAAMKVVRDAAARGEDLAEFVDGSSAEERAARSRRLGGRDIGNARAKQLAMPTWWDGVAVGLFGSLVDAHTPHKPPSAYLGMRAGRMGTG